VWDRWGEMLSLPFLTLVRLLRGCKCRKREVCRGAVIRGVTVRGAD
jgi:hypothetical protein